MIQSGEVIFIKELYLNPDIINYNNKYVRITGELVYFDSLNRICVLSHQSYTLIISTALVGIDESYLNTVVQVLGEIRIIGDMFQSSLPMDQLKRLPYYMNVNIFRSVDKIDILLYEKVILKRRSFLKELANNLESLI